MRHLLVAVLLLTACKKENAKENVNANAKENANANANVNANVERPKPAPAVPTASPEADAAFWAWFKAHRVEVANVKRADEPIANQMAAELHKVDPRLIFELGIGIEPKEVIISADGMREAFPAVKRLVAAAPPIPGWKAIAFRPRKEAGLQIQMGDGLKLGADDLWFLVLPTSKPPAPIDLVVYLPGMRGQDDNDIKQVGFLLLDATLGEYDAETKVGGIAWKPIAEKPATAKPFRDLAKLVDAWK